MNAHRTAYLSAGHRTRQSTLDGVAALGTRIGRSPLVRRLAAVAVLGGLAWKVGVSQSLHAVGAIDARALVAALVLTASTTLCCAWRWRLVSSRIGAQVPLRTAVADCYRSQFLNTATPGGVLGDVHRGVRHGRRTGDAARGVRSVVWERTAGQVVQAVLALVVLSALPSPVRPAMAWGWGAAAVVLVCTGLRRSRLRRSRLRRSGLPRTGLARTGVARTGLAPNGVRRTGVRRTGVRRTGPGRVGTGVVTAWCEEIRRGVLARGTWPLVALASALAVTGHVLTFLVAARTAGSTATATGLVPLAFVVLLASGIPTNLAGWGPREGVAAWVFGAAGLGAGVGLSTAVVYGVLVVVASLPGAVVLVASHVGRRAADATDDHTTAAAAAATVAVPVARSGVASAVPPHLPEVRHG